MEKCRCVKPCSELDTVVFLQGQFEETTFFKLAQYTDQNTNYESFFKMCSVFKMF